jgi:hypothetical protein
MIKRREFNSTDMYTYLIVHTSCCDNRSRNIITLTAQRQQNKKMLAPLLSSRLLQYIIHN